MKALKSDLAKRLLSNPETREQLNAVVRQSSTQRGAAVTVRDNKTGQTFQARVVTKAA